jgi:spore coat protein U-like protein
LTRLPACLTLLLGLMLAATCLLWPMRAEASVTCSFTSASIAFGSSSTATGSLGYSCTGTDFLGSNFTLCSTLGAPSAGTSSLPAMTKGASHLSFNLYTDSARTQVWANSITISKAISIPGTLFGVTVTGSIPFYGAIPAGQSPASGNYSGSFGGTIMGVLVSGSCNQSHSSFIPQFFFTGASSTLSASATIVNACTVTSSSALALGTVSAAASGVSGSTAISINCSSGTAYYVGLSPSNGNVAGLGALSGTGINTDKPAYQLHSVSNAGPVWGNTATATSVSNGVAGTGTGSAQTLTTYATLPSANYTPDSYSDTVTVNVNF